MIYILKKDLQKFADKAGDGLIIFSLGSNTYSGIHYANPSPGNISPCVCWSSATYNLEMGNRQSLPIAE